MMPVIKFQGDTPEEKLIISQIIDDPAWKCLRKSKPKQPAAAYVWRMVAFYVSPERIHQCMPVMAPYYLNISDHKEETKRCKELDVLVDKIVKSVPDEQQHGANRWLRAIYG
jgi:hypothetical protein